MKMYFVSYLAKKIADFSRGGKYSVDLKVWYECKTRDRAVQSVVVCVLDTVTGRRFGERGGSGGIVFTEIQTRWGVV